jgi:peptide-methionine (S)-S-oxide reductase
MTKKAIFGGGCFWCIEATLTRLRGVERVTSGYSGGTMPNPTYEQVCSGSSGHVEVVEVEYDPAIITYHDLLNVFFAMHDPTTLNRQGNDVGEQYRSVIFTEDEAQQKEAEAFIKQLTADGTFDKPIVTEVKPAMAFYKAEEYHQSYYDKNKEAGYCSVIISPKIAKLRKAFAPLLKADA